MDCLLRFVRIMYVFSKKFGEFLKGENYKDVMETKRRIGDLICINVNTINEITIICEN